MRKLLAGPILILCTILVCSVAFAADNERKHRVGVLLGPHFPSGEYKEPGIPAAAYKTGVTFGLDYNYMFSKNVGFGAFLEVTNFSSESVTFRAGGSNYKADVDITTTVFGVSGLLAHQLDNKLRLYGALKLGIASNNIEANVSRGSASTSVSDTGSTVAAILEGGVRYPLTDLLDIGVAARYSAISQSVEGSPDTKLGGFSVLGTLGFNF